MAKPRECPTPCNVLLVGGGGREHALAWKLAQSPRLGTLWISDLGSQNAGLAEIGSPCPIAMDMRDTFRMRRWCETNDIHLVVVGPEASLAAGITDALQGDGRLVFGPSKAAAQLEADKAFAKQLMKQAAVPAAEGRSFSDAESARAFVIARPDDAWVIKAAGLAAGKGVIVCDTLDESLAAIERMLEKREFGDAARTIIIEEKLLGQEVSVLALVDGRTISILDPCQDHKQVGEGDVGPNTGGMGAYCPTPLLDASTMALIERQVLVPIVDALKTHENITYRGVLYAGLMLTPGGPKVLEFNCRFGDPECQTLMARFRGDLVEVLWATAAGVLDQVEFDFDPRVACCVVMCSAGYPGPFEKGKPIIGLDELRSMPDVLAFHAGTARRKDRILTNGGRVLGITALGDDLQSARDLANAACEKVHFEGAHWRRDIGDRVLVRA